MAKRSKKFQKSQANLQEFVVVVFAETLEQAKDYATILRANDIPATVSEQQEDPTGGSSIAVMVPEDCLDEAHVVIESQDAYDDFYDLALEDQEDDFGSDFLDDEF